MSLEGSQLSHYRVLAKLGQGAFGTVYRAEDLKLGRHAALKVLSVAAAVDTRARERFRAEARAVAALDHPHICTLYELVEHDAQPIIAMQFVDGENLKQALGRGPLPEERVREIIVAVASALAAAHAHGIIHRDVKSENILLGRDGGIKLCDFGVARLAEAARLTTVGTIVGTPAYMAPEQIGGGLAGEAVDQFALAVVGYESLTGNLPFQGDSVTALLYAITHTEPRLSSRLRPGLSSGWDSVLGRALSKDPSRRYGSMDEFARAVARTAPRAPGGPAAHAPGTHPPGGETLAVLYFDNLSDDRDNDYFCAGITEDILTDLSKVPGLKVASRHASERYRGQSVDIRRVAEDLGVDAVLEGSVRRAGDRLRINVQLISAIDGFHLWAERYDRTLEDVFAVQEDIAGSIASALRYALTSRESQELMRTRPRGVEAYDLYLKGRELYGRYTLDDNRQALECFEQALRVDSDYALAWAGVADCCAQMRGKFLDMDPAWLERGMGAGERAVELNPSLPEAHKALALQWETRGDIPRSMTYLKRAIRINPNFSPALSNLGFLSVVSGDLARAEGFQRRAITADAYNWTSYARLGYVYLYTGRHRECVDHLHRLHGLDRGSYHKVVAYAATAWALAYLGDLPAAENEIQEARSLSLGGPYLAAAEALVAAMSGQRDRARRLIEQSEGERPDAEHGLLVLVEAAAWLDDIQAAVRILRASEELNSFYLPYWFCRIAPGLSRIRGTPEFRDWVGERGRRLVWPLEAPPLPPEDRAQFTDYTEASGLPVGEAFP